MFLLDWFDFIFKLSAAVVPDSYKRHIHKAINIITSRDLATHNTSKPTSQFILLMHSLKQFIETSLVVRKPAYAINQRNELKPMPKTFQFHIANGNIVIKHVCDSKMTDYRERFSYWRERVTSAFLTNIISSCIENINKTNGA